MTTMTKITNSTRQHYVITWTDMELSSVRRSSLDAWTHGLSMRSRTGLTPHQERFRLDNNNDNDKNNNDDDDDDDDDDDEDDDDDDDDDHDDDDDDDDDDGDGDNYGDDDDEFDNGCCAEQKWC